MEMKIVKLPKCISKLCDTGRYIARLNADLVAEKKQKRAFSSTKRVLQEAFMKGRVSKGVLGFLMDLRGSRQGDEPL